MDAAEYKHLVLGLIFLKYISDSFEEHRAKLLAGEGDYAGANPEDPDEFKAENVFWMPCWSHLQANAKTAAQAIKDIRIGAARMRTNSFVKNVSLIKNFLDNAFSSGRIAARPTSISAQRIDNRPFARVFFGSNRHSRRILAESFKSQLVIGKPIEHKGLCRCTLTAARRRNGQSSNCFGFVLNRLPYRRGTCETSEDSQAGLPFSSSICTPKASGSAICRAKTTAL